jgi:hypothetical protein
MHAVVGDKAFVSPVIGHSAVGFILNDLREY